MAIDIISIKCPECGASLDIEADRDQAFCTYCGAKVRIVNENEYVYRRIDEAGVKKAETDRIIKLKQLEIAEKNRASAEKTKTFKMKACLILVVAGIIMLVGGFLLGGATGDSDSDLYMISMGGMASLLAALYIGLLSNNKDD